MTRAAPQVTLRPIEAADFPRLAEIHNMLYPDPITAGDLQREKERRHPETIFHEMVALDNQQRVLGRNGAYHRPGFPAGRFFLHVEVDRAYHGQGVGAPLYQDLLNFVRMHQGTDLDIAVPESVPGALPFAQHRGFTLRRHFFPSRLLLTAFDETPFVHIIKEVETSGIRFFRQAEVGNAPEIQRKLYEMIVVMAEDQPGFDGLIPPFEQLQKQFQDAEHYRLDTQMIAADGERWVGSAHLLYHPEKRYMTHWGTGIDRAYRGRHIAFALKLLGIQAARRYDVEYLSTANDSENAPMLAINRKLGYQPQPGVYVMRCQLAT
jgi:GNAT superfamily N-acetyltransferase